jgi:hypothetical protein
MKLSDYNRGHTVQPVRLALQDSANIIQVVEQLLVKHYLLLFRWFTRRITFISNF